MTQWGFVIDVSKCNACYCCFAACKDEYWENDYPPYSAEQPRHTGMSKHGTKREM